MTPQKALSIFEKQNSFRGCPIPGSCNGCPCHAYCRDVFSIFERFTNPEYYSNHYNERITYLRRLIK